jgi:hypothetical protein
VLIVPNGKTFHGREGALPHLRIGWVSSKLTCCSNQKPAFWYVEWDS